MAPFIELKDVSYRYMSDNMERQALTDINLSIGTGEYVAVLGANGSGKSTLARLLNGLLLPTTGQCVIGGIDTKTTAELWRVRQTVGMVFQNPDNQIVAAVVEDDIAFGLENLGVSPEIIRRQVTEALAAVGLTECRKLAPHLLSGGQKQRLAIAGMLAMRPACIVLDEPTAMLDPVGRAEILEAVTKLNNENKISIIYITHFIAEALQAQRVIIMSEGRIVRDGAPREIFTDIPLLRRLKLAAPLAVEIAAVLREDGFDLPPDILTDDELVKAICRLK